MIGVFIDHRLLNTCFFFIPWHVAPGVHFRLHQKVTCWGLGDVFSSADVPEAPVSFKQVSFTEGVFAGPGPRPRPREINQLTGVSNY